MIKNNNYNKKYFAWQKKAGLYGASQDLWMYQELIKPQDCVLDFGCGGGYMLAKINCKEKYGVDINNSARLQAKKNGINTSSSLEALPANILFDVIMSHHTLEHVVNPALTLKSLRKKLKKKGTIVCVVPIDDWRNEKKYISSDINKHLYTWTPLLIGNLFSECGFAVKKVEIISRSWLPLSRFYYKYIPNPIYQLLSAIWSILSRSRQIRVTASL